MKLYIVILCYRVPDLTIDCLRSLSGEIGRVPGARVGLLENGSGGDSADRLRRAIDENGWADWVDLTEVTPNRGFTGGNNLLIRPALDCLDPPEYVLLLNSDTIVKEHALDALVEFMDSHPRAGIAGSRMLWPDGEIRASPFRFFGIASEFDRGLHLGIVSKLLSPWSAVAPAPEDPAVVEWVSGASMILRRTMLEEIGLLDEGLYTYFDDLDICLRARRSGWQTWYVPASKVIHLGGSSTGVSPKVRESTAGLLVPGPPAVLPEELRQGLHGAGRRRLHSRVIVAPIAPGDPPQTRLRSSELPDRLDPPQRFLHRVSLD